jgi:hypothetical protein
VGVGTWLLVLFAGSAAVKPGVDFEEPIMMVIGPPLYAIFANLAYTSGPVLDTVVYRGTPRKHLLKAGYVFSILLTALPGVWALIAWLCRGSPKPSHAGSLLDSNHRFQARLTDELIVF